MSIGRSGHVAVLLWKFKSVESIFDSQGTQPVSGGANMPGKPLKPGIGFGLVAINLIPRLP